MRDRCSYTAPPKSLTKGGFLWIGALAAGPLGNFIGGS